METENNTFMGLPNPLPDIYRADNANSAVSNYIQTLSQETMKEFNVKARIMQNACKEYHFLISNKKIISRTRNYFNQIHQYTVKMHTGSFVKTIARTKGWISYFNKCMIKLHKQQSPASIRDIYACRSILDSASGKDTLNLIKQCYQVMNENIQYLISLGFTPCDAEPLKDTENFNPDENPEIIVPEHSYLSPENKPYVKDYIATPKDNTYQSLHIIFKDKYGNYFEYQVRTYSMDINAEVGKASHKTYKDNQKKKDSIPKLNIDRNKIKISGYRCDDKGLLISDDSGIESSAPFLCRIQKN